MALKTCKTVEKTAIPSERVADGRRSCYEEIRGQTYELLILYTDLSGCNWSGIDTDIDDVLTSASHFMY